MSVIQGAVYAATYTNAVALTGSTVVLTVTAPDLTTTTPSVTVSGVTATASVPGGLVGQYLLLWTVTGTVTDAQQDQFSTVAAALDLVSLSDIKQDLRIAATDITYDAQLRRWIKAATGVVERITGPVTPKTETYWLDGTGIFLVLPRRWVMSITSLVETIATVNYTLTEQPLGSSTNNYGYTWDRYTQKVVRRGAGGAAIPFAKGISNVNCTYVAGMTVIPEDVQLAANSLATHFFKKKNIPVGSLLKQQAEMTPIGNYLVPNEVLELLMPYALTPGIY